MQERVRKQAAMDLMQKRGGWFANFGKYMEAAMNGVAKSVDASMDDFDEAPRVTPPSPPSFSQPGLRTPLACSSNT